jgi:hypothetical protein
VSDQLARYGSQKARSHFTWTGISQQILSLVEAEVRKPRGSLPVRRRQPRTEQPAMAGD